MCQKRLLGSYDQSRIRRYCLDEESCDALRESPSDIVDYDDFRYGDAIVYWYYIEHNCEYGCVWRYGSDYCITEDVFYNAWLGVENLNQPTLPNICQETDRDQYNNDNGYQPLIPGKTKTSSLSSSDECVKEEKLKERCRDQHCGAVNAADGEIFGYLLHNFRYANGDDCSSGCASIYENSDFCVPEILTQETVGFR